MINRIENYRDFRKSQYPKRFKIRRKPVSYVELAQSFSPEKYMHSEELSKMTYSELLSASHALSIAQNGRVFDWSSVPSKVSEFVHNSIKSGSVDKDLAALNRQIVLRIDEQE